MPTNSPTNPHRQRPPDDITNPVENPRMSADNPLDLADDSSVNGSMNTTTMPTKAPTAADPFAALTQSFMPKRAVSYLRVSTREQAEKGGLQEGFSIPAQRGANKKKAQSIGAMVVKEFVERGVSGTSTNRPALQEMLRYLKSEAENIDYVIVHKLDRLARNRADDVEINKQFDELGIRLISTSENIDQTPGGVLLHGIMSSIAEFYSKNLSNEVIKGMTQKVRSGGTPGRAPIGYLNIRTLEEGREARTVIVDETRAPLVTWAFQAYATGEWTLDSLGKELTKRGLRTVPTARMRELPIQKRQLDNVLNNPYYTGIVTYQGVEYPGNHTPLIDKATYDKVQAILHGKLKGERSRKHHHYLKSTVYCGHCKSRLIIQKARSSSNGEIYEYFSCAGRLAKRTDCEFRSIQFHELEEKIQHIYDRITIDPNMRASMESMVRRDLDALNEESTTEKQRLQAEKLQIERKQQKLIEAHYNDAISLELLRTEQQRLDSELSSVVRSLNSHSKDAADTDQLISLVFDICQDIARSYKAAPPHIKRMFNQALFERIEVFFDHYDFTTTSEGNLTEGFLFLSDNKIRRAAAGITQERKKLAENGKLSSYDSKTDRALSYRLGLCKSTLVPPVGLEPTLYRF